MRRWVLMSCALLAALVLSGQAGAAGVKLNFYRATVSQDVYRDLLAKGTDIAAATTSPRASGSNWCSLRHR
jgi:hypothetical protein